MSFPGPKWDRGVPGRFTSDKLKRAYAKSEVWVDEEGEWLALRAAMRFTGRSKCYLRDHKEGSQLLGGRGLRTNSFKDPETGRETEYWFKKDLQDLVSATVLTPTTPQQPGHFALEDAMETTGLGSSGVRRLIYKGHKTARINPTRRRKEAPGKTACGSVVSRTLYPRAICDSYHRKREQSLNLPRHLLTVRQAADLLGVTKGRIMALIRSKKLRKVSNRLVFANGIRKGMLLYRSEVAALLEKKSTKPPVSYFVDDEGTWHMERSADAKYAHAAGYMLRRYRNKPCPQMPNFEVLHAKPLPEEFRTNNHAHPWGYLDADLKRLGPPKAPGFRMTTAKIPEMARHLSVSRASHLTGISVDSLYRIARVQLAGSTEKFSRKETGWNNELHAIRIANPNADHSRFSHCIVFRRDECERVSGMAEEQVSRSIVMPGAARETEPHDLEAPRPYPVDVISIGGKPAEDVLRSLHGLQEETPLFPFRHFSGEKMRALLRALWTKGKRLIGEVTKAVYGSDSKGLRDALVSLKNRTNKKLAEENVDVHIKRSGETLELSPL
jgi:excisionase family DNA binding protein